MKLTLPLFIFPVIYVSINMYRYFFSVSTYESKCLCRDDHLVLFFRETPGSCSWLSFNITVYLHIAHTHSYESPSPPLQSYPLTLPQSITHARWIVVLRDCCRFHRCLSEVRPRSSRLSRVCVVASASSRRDENVWRWFREEVAFGKH